MSNPIFNESAWNAERAVRGSETMTVTGTAMKTAVLVSVLLIAFGIGWNQVQTTQTLFGLQPMLGVLVSAIVALLASVVAFFVPAIAAPLAFVYAAAKGIVLALITLHFESIPKYHGIGLQAAGLTVATLFGMLILYSTGIIRATPMFMKVIIGATVGLALGTGLLMLANVFGIGGGISAALYGNGPIGIAFGVFCVGLAAFNLVVDFAFIEGNAEQGMPKRYEWLGALGLVVTLAWLYLELLRLLARLRR
jgi:uncharacterized YccA/Bax inhibitor family protein